MSNNVMRATMTLAMIAALGWTAPARGYEAGAVSGGGSISGTVKYKGTAPAPAKLDVNKDKEVCGTTEKTAQELVVSSDGGIKWAVVSIQNISKGKAFEEKKPTLDQKGCEYLPHVSLVPAGKEIEILNSDGILHNIHTYSQKNPPVNRAQPKFKKSISETFKEPENVKVGCDVHGWMHGWLIVQDHPYYAITDDKGTFKLTDVPPGDYEVKIWQEKLGETTQKVSVKAGADTPVTVEMAAK